LSPLPQGSEHAKECHDLLLRPALTAEETAMKILYRRCAGLDLHEKSISACIRIVKNGKEVETVEATFSTFTEDLEQLRRWLLRNRVQRVAMESTGVYWRPELIYEAQADLCNAMSKFSQVRQTRPAKNSAPSGCRDFQFKCPDYGRPEAGQTGRMDQQLLQKKQGTVDAGTLVLDMYDAAKKELIWTGRATKIVDKKGSEKEKEDRLTKAVAKLLASYPPK
jgi:hypothetical protein